MFFLLHSLTFLLFSPLLQISSPMASPPYHLLDANAASPPILACASGTSRSVSVRGRSAADMEVDAAAVEWAMSTSQCTRRIPGPRRVCIMVADGIPLNSEGQLNQQDGSKN